MDVNCADGLLSWLKIGDSVIVNRTIFGEKGFVVAISDDKSSCDVIYAVGKRTKMPFPQDIFHPQSLERVLAVAKQ